MTKKTYMLDTCICSYIMREKPLSVLQQLQEASQSQCRLVISAITYAELQYGAASKKASPKHQILVNAFVQRVDMVLAWDRRAVDASTTVKTQLEAAGTPISSNDTAIAGHAIAAECVLVSNNTREFSRVKDLMLEDWV